MQAVKNPTPAQTREIIGRSKHQAARKITDPRDGAVWVWPFEQATHAEGAAHLGVPYDRPPGGGDVLLKE
jgi:hypothetical protein